MENLSLLMDLHKKSLRQGPGGEIESEKALNLAMIDRSAPLRIADIGCGTGASSLLLARLLDARITAVDFLAGFLDVLHERAVKAGLAEKITTLAASMDDLPFGKDQYDIIWSEGAIYNIGFTRGIRDWKRYLKVGGMLVVSEITWLDLNLPPEIKDYWEKEYPEIATASAKMRVLEEDGYLPVGYFFLPQHCWLDNYYLPLQNEFAGFLERHRYSEPALEIVAAEKREIELYTKYRNYFSYGFYIAKKL
jgi:ubiquinone/menaquinone biosynthesis C-methylase UbiE